MKTAPKPTAAANMPSTTQAQDKFKEGLALHHKGQLAQAQQIYHEVLKLQPQHFESLHFLGVISYQQKNCSQAIDWPRKQTVTLTEALLIRVKFDSSVFIAPDIKHV